MTTPLQEVLTWAAKQPLGERQPLAILVPPDVEKELRGDTEGELRILGVVVLVKK